MTVPPARSKVELLAAVETAALKHAADREKQRGNFSRLGVFLDFVAIGLTLLTSGAAFVELVDVQVLGAMALAATIVTGFATRARAADRSRGHRLLKREFNELADSVARVRADGSTRATSQVVAEHQKRLRELEGLSSLEILPLEDNARPER